MPKVIFRPNPGPTPFPPPQPQYTTELHVTFDPATFEADDSVLITVEPASLPSFTYVEFKKGDTVQTATFTLFRIASFEWVFNTPMDHAAGLGFDGTESVAAVFYDINWVEIYRIPVIL